MITEVKITIEDINGISTPTKIVNIEGQLDESNVDNKIQEIYHAIENAPHGLNLIFNLEKLVYLNSKSIGYLTDLYGKISENGGKVMIASAKPNITDILQVVGLTQLIPMYGSLDEVKIQINNSSQNPTPQI